MDTLLLRVQDSEGRGPFRPGVTVQWCEYNHELPSTIAEFPELMHEARRLNKQGFHLGTAVRGYDGLKKWFSENELNKLDLLGYRVVVVKHCAIVYESENQIVFCTKKPLRELKVA